MDNVNSLYKEYIDKMPVNIVTKNDIDDYEKEFWKAHKELNTKALIDELVNAHGLRRQQLLELLYYSS
jgi:hypothetical protein